MGELRNALEPLSPKFITGERGYAESRGPNFFLRKCQFSCTIMSLNLTIASTKSSRTKKNELQSQIHELEMDMNEMCDKLWQEIQNEGSRVQNLERESLKLVQENEGLKEYIDYLEDSVVCGNCSDTLRNTGKPLNEVSARQVTRKIKELNTTAQKALWFCSHLV